MITIGFTTAREEPCFEWFYDALMAQPGRQAFELIVIDFHAYDRDRQASHFSTRGKYLPPKPTVWAGPTRLPRSSWWHVAAARNTVICAASAMSSYVAFVDDRALPGPHWIEAIEDAARGGYAVAGAYEKRERMTVRAGKVVEPGHVLGRDHRLTPGDHARDCGGSWFFGGTLGMPLDWALDLNGFDERVDGLSSEDCLAGLQLQNAGRRIVYDPRAFVTQDRTPSVVDHGMKRSSKERHPHDTADKGHEALRRFGGAKRADHGTDLRKLREGYLRGEGFPPHGGQPEKDWFDDQPLRDFD